MKNKWKKLLAMALALSMTMGMLGVSAWAEEDGVDGGQTSTTYCGKEEHAHSGTTGCYEGEGWPEKGDESYVLDEDTGLYYLGLACVKEVHTHTNECYVAPQPEESESPTPAQCTCTTKCTADSVNSDCPVCSAEDADLTNCVGEEPAEDDMVEVASYDELTAAIAGATEPTTIKLTQSFAIPTGYLQITSGKDIVLTADPDAVLSRETNASILVRTGGKLALRDITIDGNGDDGVTGGYAMVYVYKDAVCEITDGTVIKNCHSTGNGGALYNTGTLTITDSTFTGNTAGKLGGGVYSTGTLTITGGSFSGNQGGGKVGGAVYSNNKGSTNKISDAEFTGNAPGAVSVSGGTLEGLSITNNIGNGPALKVDYAVTVESCVISHNENTTPYFENGGAVFAGSNADATFKDCTIVGNTGVMCGGVCVFQCNKVRLDGTVVKNNTATSSEETAVGGIYVGDLAELTFQSGALYNNGPVDLFRVSNGRTLNVLDAVDMVDPELRNDSYFVDYNYAWQCNGEILQDSVSAILDSGVIRLIAVPLETPTVNNVYLNGANGNDEQNGSRPAFAVKTLDRAVELAKDHNVDTIYVSGAVTLTDNVDGNGVTLVRAKGYKGNLLVSKTDATLTNITLDGNWKNLSSADDNYNNTASLVKVTGGNLTLGNGVTLKDNQVYNYTYPQNVGGGVYVSGGKLTIDGATITECVAAQGGAVGAFSGEIVMNSGTISNNSAKYWYNTSGYGGGVFIAQTARFVMNGGTIEKNTALRGGGICVGSTVGNQRKDGAYNLEVHGGTIQGNYASYSGGGIYVAAGQDSANIGYSALVDGTVSTVHIQNNKAGGHDGSFFHGGGIYVNGGKSPSDGFLKLECVVITDNTATGVNGGDKFGSGFAGCGTSETAIYFSNGGAIYGNTGDDFLTDTIGQSVVFNLPHINVAPTMLGGGNYNWTHTANGKAVPLDWLSGDGLFQMNAKPADTDIVAANSVARVFITGNTAGGLGGGVGSNGRVQIGDAPEYEAIEFTVTKEWHDAGHEDQRPEAVTAYVERSLDNVNWETLGTVSMSGNHAGENLDWKTQVKNLLKNAWNANAKDYTGTPYVYRVREVPVANYKSTVTGDMEKGFTIGNAYTPPTTPTPGPSEGPDEPDPTPTPTPEPTPAVSPEPTPTAPVEDLDENDTPLAELPTETQQPAAEPPKEEIEDLEDGDVPMAQAPETGDSLGTWLMMSAGALLGLAWLGKKKEEA